MRVNTRRDSVEIRRMTEGHCACAIPQPNDHVYICRHWWECDFGTFENGEVDTRRPIRHLMLAYGATVARMLDNGPEPNTMDPSATFSATRDGHRLFVHLDWRDQRWTWEMFAAHFADGAQIEGFMVGRWAD